VYGYEGQHYTVGAVHHRAQTDPSPMSYGLWAGCVPVMTCSKQKDCKLDLDGGLGDVQIVVKDVVVAYRVDDAIEDVEVHMYSFPVLIKVSVAPEFEEMEL